jgi:hypothetical protein
MKLKLNLNNANVNELANNVPDNVGFTTIRAAVNSVYAVTNPAHRASSSNLSR